MSRPLLLWVVPSRDHIGVNEGNDEIWLAIRSGHFAFSSVASFQPLSQPFSSEPIQAAHADLPLVCLQILLNRCFCWGLLVPALCTDPSLTPELWTQASFWVVSLCERWPSACWHLPSIILIFSLQKDSTLAYLGCFFTRAATIPSSYISGSLVQFSRSVVSDSLWPHESQHTRPPCPSPIPGVHSDSRPSSQWCHPAISSSVIPFSSCPKSLPASESFLMSQLFTWSGQSTGVSALASFLPKKSQGWSSEMDWGWIFLQSKGLSRVFSNTTVQKHQFFGTQSSSQSNSHIHTWPLEKP